MHERRLSSCLRQPILQGIFYDMFFTIEIKAIPILLLELQ